MGGADAVDVAGRQGGPVQRHAQGRNHSKDPGRRMLLSGTAVALAQAIAGVSAAARPPTVVDAKSIGLPRSAVDSDKHWVCPPSSTWPIFFDDAGRVNLLSARNDDGVLPVSRLKFRLKVDSVSYPTSRPIVVMLYSVSTKS